VQALRAILKACEAVIADLRVQRERAEREMALARVGPPGSIGTLGQLLLHIDQHYGGIMPPAITSSDSRHRLKRASDALGGYKVIQDVRGRETEVVAIGHPVVTKGLPRNIPIQPAVTQRQSSVCFAAARIGHRPSGPGRRRQFAVQIAANVGIRQISTLR
jgi:hypothetical protein